MEKFTATPLGREHLRRERNKKLALKSQYEGQIVACKEIQHIIGDWCEQDEVWQQQNPLSNYLINLLDGRRLNLEEMIDEIRQDIQDIKTQYEESKA